MTFGLPNVTLRTHVRAAISFSIQNTRKTILVASSFCQRHVIFKLMESPYSMPAASHLHPLAGPNLHPDNHAGQKPWRSRLPFSRSCTWRQPAESEEALSDGMSGVHPRPPKIRDPKWWKVRLFRGIVNDIRRRAPFYWSDWSDAWDYRVIPATVYMYFVWPHEILWKAYIANDSP